MSPYASYLVETFVTLVAVCALAFVVLYGARRVGVGRATGAVRLVGQLPLDARRAVYLVRVGSRVLVVGAGEGGLTKLAELGAEELPEMPELERRELPFSAVLARVIGRSSRDEHDASRGNRP